VWCDHADDVRGLGIGSGHLMPEEHPDRVYAALKEFFSVWLSFRLLESGHAQLSAHQRAAGR
jgi:hypothetical protein